MQDSKWSPSQESAPVYLPLQSNNYAYREALDGSGPNEGETTMHRMMSSLTQPGTPRPDTISLPPTPLVDGNKSPPERPSLQARPASFTSMSTFPSHPYQLGPPIRKRRADSIFSFEMGPSFSSTKQLHELFSLDQTNGYQVQLQAKMDRGFFRADQDWACYRRNYFQVSATFDVHGINYLLQGPEVPCLLRKSDQQQQELRQVDYFSIGVSACVSNNTDKKIELVQHTPKRDKGPQMVPKPQAVRAGGNLHLASVGSSHHIVTFERMQFKTATANNGKRRAAQQYYEIVISLYANTCHGESILVATCHSAPLVVRGRSPGHYADSHTRYRHSLTAAAANAPPPPPPPPPLGHHHHHDQPNGNHPAAGSMMPPPPQPDRAAHLPPPPPGATQARFMSLPTSPVSDFGPYSPYSSYGYHVAYSPHAPEPPHHQPPPPQSHISTSGVHYPTHASQQDQSSYFARPEDKAMMPPPPHPTQQQQQQQHSLMYDRSSPYYGDSSYPPTRDSGEMLDDKLPSTSVPSSAPASFSTAPGYPPYPYEDYGASYTPPTSS